MLFLFYLENSLSKACACGALELGVRFFADVRDCPQCRQAEKLLHSSGNVK